MTALVGLALLAPLVGALAAVAQPVRHRLVLVVAAGFAAVSWAVSVAGGDPTPVVLGRLTVDPLLAAAAAGLATVTAASSTTRPVSTSIGLSSLTLFAAAAAASSEPGPDRTLAVGIAVLVVLVGVRVRIDDGTEGLRSGLGLVLGLVGALVVAGGLVVEDPDAAAVVVLAGAGAVAVAVGAASRRSLAAVIVVVPAVLLAVVRVTAAAGLPIGGAEPSGGTDLVAAAGVAVGVIGVVSLVVVRNRSWVRRVPVAAVLGAIVLLAQSGTGQVGSAATAAIRGDLRATGILLGAGAVLALVGRHPLALLALGPGCHALVASAGLLSGRDVLVGGGTDGGGGMAAAAGAVLLALAVLALLGTPADAGRSDPPTAAVAAAVAFGLVPLWSWSAGDQAGDLTAGYDTASFAAAAVVVSAAVGLTAMAIRRGVIAPRSSARPLPPPVVPPSVGRPAVVPAPGDAGDPDPGDRDTGDAGDDDAGDEDPGPVLAEDDGPAPAAPLRGAQLVDAVDELIASPVTPADRARRRIPLRAHIVRGRPDEPPQDR